MSKISRSVHMKVVNERNRLLKDIEILIDIDNEKCWEVMNKWISHFEKKRQFNQLMFEISQEWIKENPDNLIVKAIIEHKSTSK